MSTPSNDTSLPCTVPGCTASHLVTSLDRVGDDGRPVSETEAVMVAHFRAEHQAKLVKPFVPRPTTKTPKSGPRRTVRAV